MMPAPDAPRSCPVRMAVLAVALQARVGRLMPMQVDELRSKAEAELPRGDDVRTAVLTFATQYEGLRHDAYAVGKLGEALQASLHDALGLTPAAPAFRRDIDG